MTSSPSPSFPSPSSSSPSVSPNIKETKKEIKELEAQIAMETKAEGKLEDKLKDIQNAMDLEKAKGKEERDEVFITRKNREADRIESNLDAISQRVKGLTNILIALQNHYQHLISSSSRKHQRSTSLPTPESGYHWTMKHLTALNFSFISLPYSLNDAEIERCFWVTSSPPKSKSELSIGDVEMDTSSSSLTSTSSSSTSSSSSSSSSVFEFKVSERANRFIQSLLPMDSISLIGVLPSDGPYLVMHKYVAMVTKALAREFKLTESTVDIFVVQLLTYLGFNDGDLLIISKNNLKFSMNGKNNVIATADVTVVDVRRGFRLVVAESKRELEEGETIQAFEAQLMAEVIAAAQSNLTNRPPKRPMSAASSFSPLASNPPLSISLFCILIMGVNFFFYRAHLDEDFVDGVADYDQMPEDFVTPVYRLVEKSKSLDPHRPESRNGFDFCIPNDRKCIVEILDRMQQLLSRID